ncbi:hypothetical protein PPTG_07517 [Phytophthora nicotianae INRA-310]|uniref:HAT C-terminal dimerisation domain-containing protein n=1 Tax=Phytophthora nicotianae (strain INRA-310) TaxID=761204 RepID=W2QQD8_PHYN3|nr:hypothetical protein PPTG_07517 [Phytophthora nicotianae INRA-310]ETN14470.1 hypothetical protein PPTG_07517 [Phytophthora nicotianae INRA-310]
MGVNIRDAGSLPGSSQPQIKSAPGRDGRLQSIDLNLLDARDLFNGLLEIKPSLSHYLAPNSDIVHSPDFELGVVKVHGGQAKRLSRAERSALQLFLRRSTTATCEEEEAAKLGFADRILKRRKVEAEPSAYILLHAIPPTSNIVERLFSVARMVLRYERNRLTPLVLEMILFLKVNSLYWDVTTVDACV